ncbi:MAG TPA: twin-arginine translocase TatA/TatE family subunit [Syntrophomonadaceae bacterium]|nr:twin-arginine translocase TatA/TatE family subunit [Syntrophomonadaceae bacterium]
MFNVGPWELLLVLGIALIVFGPGKLPQLGESLGKAITGFKKAQAGEEDEVKAVK